ncbi:hypothetical protein D3C72_1736240 [compost metagenome]
MLKLGFEDGHVDRHLRIPQEGGIRVACIVGETDLELLQVDVAVTIGMRIDDKLRRARKAFVLLCRRLASIGRQGRDIDEPLDLRVNARLRDHGAAPGMTDEDGRAVLAVEGALRRGYIVSKRGERVLHDRHAITPRGQIVIDAAPS